MGGPEDVSREEIFQLREGANEPDQRNKLNSHQEEISHKQIRDHIKYLESELSSALRSLRTRSDEAASQVGMISLDYMNLHDYFEILTLKFYQYVQFHLWSSSSLGKHFQTVIVFLEDLGNYIIPILYFSLGS